MQTPSNKVFLALGGRDILEYSVAAARQATRVSRLVLVVRSGDEATAISVLERAGWTEEVHVVAGGATRQESERAGLSPLRSRVAAGEIDLIGIHDGARPFLTIELLDRLVEAATRHGGAIPAMPPRSPMFKARGGMLEPVPEGRMRLVQTPQIFEAGAVIDAYDSAHRDGFVGVDTTETIQRYTDLDVAAVPGDPRNLKITYPADLLVAARHAASFAAGIWTDSPR
jgi:2-C-methyl-D-erythritol 4-phosphate cytidylyltransferase